MENLVFYLFAFMAVAGGVLLVALRNPVSSALAMVLSFVGLAGLFIGLNAYFVGIVQILVYAGAIMVLFIFIIMLLDLNDEKPVKFKSSSVVAGLIIPLLLVVQILGVIQRGPKITRLNLRKLPMIRCESRPSSLLNSIKMRSNCRARNSQQSTRV